MEDQKEVNLVYPYRNPYQNQRLFFGAPLVGGFLGGLVGGAVGSAFFLRPRPYPMYPPIPAYPPYGGFGGYGYGYGTPYY